MLVADAHLLWKTSRAHIGRFGAVLDGQRRRRHCIIGFSISFISLWRVDWRRRQPSEPSHYTLERRKKNSIIRRLITTTLFRLKCEPNLQAEVKEQWAILKLKETLKKVSCQSTPLAPGRSSLFHTKIGFFIALSCAIGPARRVWRNFHDLTLLA